MRKQVLVTVDRGETRVAILEAEGAPSAAKDTDDKPAARGGRGRGRGARPANGNGGGANWRVS
ncbi:MAG: hypothetical protein QOE08_267, partial [Thermoleophilaceae bacterium]|nr:hypothetical protein [Thermoleophilaceae bacterium]